MQALMGGADVTLPYRHLYSWSWSSCIEHSLMGGNNVYMGIVSLPHYYAIYMHERYFLNEKWETIIFIAFHV